MTDPVWGTFSITNVWSQGLSQYENAILPVYGEPIMKIHCVFFMGIPLPWKMVFILKWVPVHVYYLTSYIANLCHYLLVEGIPAWSQRALTQHNT